MTHCNQASSKQPNLLLFTFHLRTLSFSRPYHVANPLTFLPSQRISGLFSSLLIITHFSLLFSLGAENFFLTKKKGERSSREKENVHRLPHPISHHLLSLLSARRCPWMTTFHMGTESTPWCLPKMEAPASTASLCSIKLFLLYRFISHQHYKNVMVSPISAKAQEFQISLHL